MATLLWKENWDRTRARFNAWWKHEGLILCVTAPRQRQVQPIPHPTRPKDIRDVWLDPHYRLAQAEYEMSWTYYGGESFPYFDTQIGPGNLATFIGSEPGYDSETVWFNPCIEDPDHHPPLSFRTDNPHWKKQMAIIEKGVTSAAGRYLVGIPDLIENVDILTSLRGMERLLEDMIDRPEFVEKRVSEINRIYFEVYDLIGSRVKDPWGGTTWAAFRVWGEGRTAKLQCDASAAFSPAMLRRFVVPALREECQWLDHSLYHLDGTQCICHLDELLAIDELDGIEWTPQAGRPDGGSPEWYELYRRILRAGKNVQAVSVKPSEVIPLLDATGPKGMYIMTQASSEEDARKLEERVEAYR